MASEAPTRAEGWAAAGRLVEEHGADLRVEVSGDAPPDLSAALAAEAAAASAPSVDAAAEAAEKLEAAGVLGEASTGLVTIVTGSVNRWTGVEPGEVDPEFRRRADKAFTALWARWLDGPASPALVCAVAVVNLGLSQRANGRPIAAVPEDGAASAA